jgi:hypothetical protein
MWGGGVSRWHAGGRTHHLYHSSSWSREGRGGAPIGLIHTQPTWKDAHLVGHQTWTYLWLSSTCHADDIEAAGSAGT